MIMILLLTSCSYNKTWQEERFIGLNTTCSIRVYSKGRINFKELEEIVEDFQKLVNFHSETSDIAKINKLAGTSYFKADRSVYFLIDEAKKYADLSNGDFDPTIGPLSSLWGIGSKNYLPRADEINKARALVDYRDVILDKDKGVLLKREGMGIDLGGIAKGYLSDILREYLISQGVESGIINLGGNISLVGDKNGEPWRIGIQDPNKGRGVELGLLEISNVNIISSGGYERKFEKDGKVFHHILDPKTGYPKNGDIISSTIISLSGVEGDALSTIYFGLTKEEFVYFQSKSRVLGIFLFSDDTLYISNELVDNFILGDSRYRLITDISLL